MPDADLKAYVTGIYFDDDELWSDLELVIAGSPEAAARLAYKDFDDKRIAEVLAGEDDYSIERCEAGDLLIGEKGSRIIRDMASLRTIGFHNEGEKMCEGCEEYLEGVCSECCLCPVCAANEPGHECELCDEASQAEAPDASH